MAEDAPQKPDDGSPEWSMSGVRAGAGAGYFTSENVPASESPGLAPEVRRDLPGHSLLYSPTPSVLPGEQYPYITGMVSV